MSQLEQNIDPNRYQIVPRTLTFLRAEGKILLMQRDAPDHPWHGRYNAIGGHVERGEDLFTAAKREIQEETGLEPVSLRLCGVVLIDTGNPGIGLFVFMGEVPRMADLHDLQSPEGKLIWAGLAEIDSLPVLEDLPALLDESLSCFATRSLFFWSYRFDPNGNVRIHRA